VSFPRIVHGPDRARLQNLDAFHAAIAEGSLPAVSFVVPKNIDSGHPGYSVTARYEAFVRDLVARFEANPALFASTAILVTTDEGGGYFDSGWIQTLDFFGDGPRIPMIVVSPYARHGHVDHTYQDHASVLKFIEYNWGLAPLSARSRDRLPNPRTDPRDPYRPVNGPAIGDLTSMTCYWLGNARAGLERLPDEDEMHYQLRNWYYFTWISGDFIVDQHIHNIDIINWIKGEHPIRAQGMGGRQVRNDKKLHGQIFDHHFVEFEYADGSKLFSQCRQGQQGTYQEVSEHVVGTKGRADLNVGSKLFRITGPNAWELRLKTGEDGHQLEHFPLMEAIRNDTPYNELEIAAGSTMMAIMGRMATYSGKVIEWDEAINSKLQLMPEKVTWDMPPPVVPDADGNYPVAIPGRTQAV